MAIKCPTTTYPQPPYPIHESVRDKLDPEYVEFYNKYIINNQQVHYQPIEASRSSGTLIPGGGPLQPVGKTEDIAIRRTETKGPDVMVRCFTPNEHKPDEGWPVMIYYHGGRITLILRASTRLTFHRWMGSGQYQYGERSLLSPMQSCPMRCH